MIRWRSLLLSVLALSAIYLYSYPAATMVYGAGVLLHTGAGILLAFCLVPILRQVFSGSTGWARCGWALVAAGAAVGLVLIKIGTPRSLRAWLYLHIALCAAGVLVLGTEGTARRGWFGRGPAGAATAFAALTLALAAVAAGSWWVRDVAWRSAYRVVNPKMPAETMNGEGDGP